jgi:hypothetical protein
LLNLAQHSRRWWQAFCGWPHGQGEDRCMSVSERGQWVAIAGVAMAILGLHWQVDAKFAWAACFPASYLIGVLLMSE